MTIRELIKIDPGAATLCGRKLWKTEFEKRIDGLCSESSQNGLGGELISFTFSGAELYYLQSGTQKIVRRRQSPNRFSPMAVVALSGGVTVTQLGKRSVIKPGEYFFLDAAAPMELDYSAEFKSLFLHFPASSFVPALFHHAIVQVVPQLSELDILFRKTIESIWSSAESFSVREHGAALNSLLSMCALTSPFRQGAREVEPCVRVTKAMSFIEHNLAEEWLSPAAVAEAQGVSRRYLDDRFGRLGLRIERWIWERRLLRARDELGLVSRMGRYTTKTILQIALDNGFKSPSHFSRSFNARFGTSPRQYRSRIEQQANHRN